MVGPVSALEEQNRKACGQGGRGDVHPRKIGDSFCVWRRDAGRGVSAFSARLAFFVALAYLLLLPLNLPVWSSLYTHDLLAPIMAALILWRRDWRKLGQSPHHWLWVFLCLSAFSTMVHLSGVSDLREWTIFAYAALLYSFFRSTRIPPRWLQRVGVVILGAMAVYAVWEVTWGTRAVYDVYRDSSLGFIARRFFFTFDHPNLVGSYYALPVLCILVSSVRSPHTDTTASRRWVIPWLTAIVLCFPLFLTVSRHMLLTGALFLGAAAQHLRHRVPGITVAACGLVLAVFGCFYLTILFPFFPLQSEWPYFNHETLGMYTIHQDIYLQMVTQDLSSFLFGVGRSAVRQLYPAFAHWTTAYRILSQYDQAFLTESFVTYMDAHNEFLNLSACFGVPAMLACYFFWAGMGCRRRHDSWLPMMLCYVLGVVLVSFWDDILSKRWIWIGLGILAHRLDATEHPTSTDPGTQLNSDKKATAET